MKDSYSNTFNGIDRSSGDEISEQEVGEWTRDDEDEIILKK